MALIATIVGFLIAAVAAVLAVFVTGMRTKARPVINAVRRLNRAVFNPRQLRSAGTPGAYASVIHHAGRRSGTAYETPVGVVTTEDGFIIGLPYGTQADWLQNVLAAGSARIVHEGETYDVDQPEIIDGEAARAYYPPREQRTHRLFGVDEFLRVRTVPTDQ